MSNDSTRLLHLNISKNLEKKQDECISQIFCLQQSRFVVLQVLNDVSQKGPFLQVLQILQVSSEFCMVFCLKNFEFESDS